MEMTTEALLRALQTEEIALFGAGFVAEQFYQALALRGLNSVIRYAVVSEARAGQRFHARPVFSLPSAPFSEKTLLCVAVHASAAGELRESLERRRVRSVWIYPNLFELLYGTPVRSGAEVRLGELLARQDPEAYWLAVRYAAIRDYLRRSRDYPRTRDVYLRALSLHCGRETAIRRSRQTEELAEAMAQAGFRRDCPVRIDEGGRIIDGLHRVACAACLGIEAVPAVVYRSSPVYDRLLDARNRLPEQVLRDAGFSSEDMKLLREANRELLAGRTRP